MWVVELAWQLCFLSVPEQFKFAKFVDTTFQKNTHDSWLTIGDGSSSEPESEYELESEDVDAAAGAGST